MIWDKTEPTSDHRRAYSEAAIAPYWMDGVGGPERPAWSGHASADLCIIGGGYTGLWAAIEARRRNPHREVVVLEGQTVGFGASGRNGGFASYSLTHGLEHGVSRFSQEVDRLERLGKENFEGFAADIADLGIDCAFEANGKLNFALAPHEVPGLEAGAALNRSFGHEVELLDAEAARAEVNSPTYLGALRYRGGTAVLDPGALVRGLADAAERLGARIYERSEVTAVSARHDGVEVRTGSGSVFAAKAIDATGAYGRVTGFLRHYVMPIYDYALVTEPLSAAQFDSIGWKGRQGLGDRGNRFHYYRRIGPDRILFGGYDAIYRFGGPVSPSMDDHDESFARLSQHFSIIFPQLEGVRFSHRWGGAIDTCSRFTPFFGTRFDGALAYVAGYTGLGVCATRFGARVALDLLEPGGSELTRLKYVRRKPLPYPPEPLRYPLVQLTRNRMAAEDRSGRPGAWLRLLNRLGLGFDS
jgi:glycine/D-amino acid oxidase-like deaminating enzyme